MMPMEILSLTSLREIERADYEALFTASGAPVFYSWPFLVAAELSPLLPYREIRYLCARQDGRLIGLMPAYLQENVDPFGVISQTAGVAFTPDTPVMLTHIMHATETCVVCAPQHLAQVAPPLLRAFEEAGSAAGAQYSALLNVASPQLMDLGRQQGYAGAYMWDRFNTTLPPGATMEQVVEALPTKGRWEMKRQRRKFAQSASTVEILPVRDADVDGFAKLCFETTKKNGTPSYYPVDAMTRLVHHCADIALVLSVRSEGRLCGSGIAFPDRNKIHFWALGVDYDLSEYSPYCMLFSALYEYAIGKQLEVLEVGRTNKYIKERLGFKPVPLYSLIKQTEGPRHVRSPAS